VTQLTFGGIFNNHFIANCPQNVSVKEFGKSVNIWRRYKQSQSGTFFWGHSVVLRHSAASFPTYLMSPVISFVNDRPTVTFRILFI